MPHTYILKCVDGTYYVGSTWDLERRIKQHNEQRGANYTQKRLPVTLVYSEYYERIDEAYNRERQIHNWSHEKKEALINGDKSKLITKAKKQF